MKHGNGCETAFCLPLILPLHTMDSFEAHVLKSFGGLAFGAAEAEVEKHFGIPEEKETLEAIDGSVSLVWHYWSNGFTVFFDNERNGKFCCVEVDSSVDMKIWEEPVFRLNEGQLKALFKQQGFRDLDEENHEWGEKRISFDDAMADFYFENGILVSVNFGVTTENENTSIYHN